MIIFKLKTKTISKTSPEELDKAIDTFLTEYAKSLPVGYYMHNVTITFHTAADSGRPYNGFGEVCTGEVYYSVFITWDNRDLYKD